MHKILYDVTRMKVCCLLIHLTGNSETHIMLQQDRNNSQNKIWPCLFQADLVECYISLWIDPACVDCQHVVNGSAFARMAISP